jgi:hypothetical protein
MDHRPGLLQRHPIDPLPAPKEKSGYAGLPQPENLLALP